MPNPDGRRVAERRAPLVAAIEPPLPRRLRGAARDVLFVTPLEYPDVWLEDTAAARAAISVQSGDVSAMRGLFDQYFDKVHTLAAVSLREDVAAAEAAQRVLLRAHELMAGFDPSAQPFRAWLFRIACECLDTVGDSAGTGAEEYERRRGRRSSVTADPGLAALRWLTDAEMRVLVESLPRAERTALLLRLMVGLTARQVAEILGCGEDEQAELVADGLSLLSSRLESLSWPAEYPNREHMCRLPGPKTVVRERRMALKA